MIIRKSIVLRTVGFALALLMLLSCVFGATGGMAASAEADSWLFLHLNGGQWSDNSTADKQYKQEAGTSFTPTETPIRDGFMFTGWQFSGSGDCSWNGSTFIFGSSGSMGHLNATWQAVQTTLTVDPNGGKWSDGTTSTRVYRNYAGVSFTPERPTRDGFMFKGWSMNSASGAGGTWNGETFVYGNADRTLTAQWYANTYQLTAKPNYGLWIPYTGTEYANAVSAVKTYSGTTGTMISLTPVYSSPYYVISGWTLLSGGTGTMNGSSNYQFGTTNDTVVPQISGTAIVSLNPGTGNWKDTNTGAQSGVRYLLFDPGYRMTISINGESKTAYRLPDSVDMSKQGHTFAGWTMQNGGSGTVLRQGNTWFYIFDTPVQSSAPQGNTNLTAQWTPVSYTLRLSGFERVSGSSSWSQYFNGTNLIEISQPYGTTVTLPTGSEIYSTGRTFLGWYPIGQVSSQPTGSGKTSFTFTQNNELYACWENNTYTVTVDPNGGYRTILTATSDYKDYDPYTVSTIYGYWLRLFGNEGPIRRDGYRLVGFTGVNGSSTAGSFINPAENPNLYDDPNNYYYRIGPTDETLVAQWKKIPDDKISVTIGDQIGVNLLLDLDARNAETVTVTYKDLNGVEQRETFTDFSSLPQVEGGLYKIAVQIAPAQIADTVTVYIDGETLDASVKDYCSALTDGGYGEEVAALAQAVLDYGQAANNYFATANYYRRLRT